MGRKFLERKVCPGCGLEKPRAEFMSGDQLRKLCNDCRPAQAAQYFATWYDSSREARSEYKREYRAGNREAISAYNRDYYAANAEEIRPKANERAKAWQRNNPTMVRARNARRRARERGAEGKYTAEEWEALLECFGRACLRCGSVDRLCADHVVPLDKGGLGGIENIQILCWSCNCSKSNRHSTDYRDPEMLSAFLASL